MERLHRVLVRAIGPRTMLFEHVPHEPAVLLMRDGEEGKAAMPDLPVEDYHLILRSLGFKQYDVKKEGRGLELVTKSTRFRGKLVRPLYNHPYYLGRVNVIR